MTREEGAIARPLAQVGILAYQEKGQLRHKKGGVIRQFRGSPDCGAFYAWVLGNINQLVSAKHPKPNPPLKELTTGQVGNLGEFLSFLVSRDSIFKLPGHTPALAGALIPLQPGTIVGLDIVVVYLDPDGASENDRLFIQEVKTTGARTLGYAKALIEDYKKLLDDTEPSKQLQTRISSIKTKLFFEHNWPMRALERVEDLVSTEAADCLKVRLMPTLIHDLRYEDPVSALSNVLDQVYSQGWPRDSVDAWSISIAKLNESLVKLANREAFRP
ncbi:hypothetical protein LMG3482_04897 [Achromobacter deleyi]|uniref:hypothetical protein n=1 Tax=Achromobacter deleyi TaxID=1353891 RepID=UPI001467376C|nr:hypothetical protein [Achromobacter deleyi]CAB3868360.1 hypothetical protein LMG3481_02625 [Achromobacter deleyi]CAB3912401.1 hypothetical protein LMG3482_04897 [Achromobacter deleyi]